MGACVYNEERSVNSTRKRKTFLPATTTLVVIYNHRYDANIDRVEGLYANRFSDIVHLMPFYDGNHPRVIPVYEASHCFQGYFAQALPYLILHRSSYYIFLGDDVLLNPTVDESNFVDILGLSELSGYVKDLVPLFSIYIVWIHVTEICRSFSKRNGTEYSGQIPDAQEALILLRSRGFMFGRLSFENLRDWNGSINVFELAKYMVRYPLLLLDIARLLLRRQLPYPLLKGYADFIIVPAASLRRFCHYCGCFAAMGLFVEAAAPTALALACPEVITEASTARQDPDRWTGLELWTDKEIREMESRWQSDLGKLEASFEPRQLYIHPVKLSRWKHIS